MAVPIHFFYEDIDFDLPQAEQVIRWIKRVIEKEPAQLEGLNIIFTSDAYLHKMNVDYLQHDTLTDVITFDNSEEPHQVIEGDIFISIDRVRNNAQTLKIPFLRELHRVIIHGVLHLLGYSDKTEAEKKQMRLREDQCLEWLKR